MRVIEIKIDGETYAAIGDDPELMPVYSFGSYGRQLTNMRWPALSKFTEPDDINDMGDMESDLINTVYGRIVAKPPKSRPLAEPGG